MATEAIAPDPGAAPAGRPPSAPLFRPGDLLCELYCLPAQTAAGMVDRAGLGLAPACVTCAAELGEQLLDVDDLVLARFVGERL